VALKSICLRGFRNLEPTSVDFAEGANYLFGPNGAGKTNLLEAIHYLAIGRSFRRCPDAEMLGFGRDVLAVSGTDESGDTAEIRFDGREKRILRNNIPVEKLSEYFGWLPVVVLLLEDIELVKGAPGIRRNFLDVAIAKAEGGVDRRRAKSEARWQRLDVRSEGEEQSGQQAKSEARSRRLEVRSEGEEQEGKSEAKSQEPKAKSEDGTKSEARSEKLEARTAETEGEGRRAKGERRCEERSYITLTSEYRRAVSQYNRLLERSGASREPVADQLSAWEESWCCRACRCMRRGWRRWAGCWRTRRSTMSGWPGMARRSATGRASCQRPSQETHHGQNQGTVPGSRRGPCEGTVPGFAGQSPFSRPQKSLRARSGSGSRRRGSGRGRLATRWSGRIGTTSGFPVATGASEVRVGG